MNSILEPLSVPVEWVDTLRDGSRVIIRPIRKEDAPLERDLLERLSEEATRFRFLGRPDLRSEVAIRRLVEVDWDRDAALVALIHRDGRKQEIGVARFAGAQDGESCECAVVVRDDWQSRGLGTALMRHLIEFARQRGLRRMYSYDDAHNERMQDLARDLGFERSTDPSDARLVVHTLKL